MKLIINATILNCSGVLQVASSFIEECKAFSQNEYYVFLCPKLIKQIKVEDFPGNFKFYDFENSPIKVRSRLGTLRKLRNLEQRIQPDCVFTVFGPAYWKPKSPHVVGFARAHSIYPNSEFFKILSFKENLFWKVKALIQKYYFKQNVSAYITETEDASARLANYLGVNPEKIATVSNTYSSYFKKFTDNGESVFLPKKAANEFRFITLASYNRHKNLEILNKVIPLLKSQPLTKSIKFVITIEQEIYNTVFSAIAKENIINLGQIKMKDCPQLYSECDALFLPSLLECFSANYPEAMKMKKPILTSDLSFAHTVCQNAAEYFNPLNPQEIVEKIQQLVENENLQKDLIQKGQERLSYFPSAKQRAEQYLEICKRVSYGL